MFWVLVSMVTVLGDSENATISERLLMLNFFKTVQLNERKRNFSKMSCLHVLLLTVTVNVCVTAIVDVYGVLIFASIYIVSVQRHRFVARCANCIVYSRL